MVRAMMRALVLQGVRLDFGQDTLAVKAVDPYEAMSSFGIAFQFLYSRAGLLHYTEYRLISLKNTTKALLTHPLCTL